MIILCHCQEHKVGAEPKIDEKRASYSSLKSKVTYEGTLKKQGGRFASWNTRRVVLAENVLYYFKNTTPKPGDMSAGSVPITICDVIGAEGKVGLTQLNTVPIFRRFQDCIFPKI